MANSALDFDLEVAEREFVFTHVDFLRAKALIARRAGIALGPAKQNMVYSRLSRRLRALALPAFSDYLDLLESSHDAHEWEAFTNALTTNLTSFFREAHHFPILASHLRRQTSHAPLRIWCAAASTGEESYSLAMTACEAFGSAKPPVRIVASDIDTQVLATARRGVYALDRLDNLSAAQKRQFFHRGTGPSAGFARVRPELRALVEFRTINLHDANWALDRGFTAIFCRNVLIYFDRPTQAAIVARFAPLLADDGLLFTGHSEALGPIDSMFRPRGKTVYEKAANEHA